MRIVALSDTHGFHKDVVIPDGDVLVFAGDFLRYGSRRELIEFNTWLGTLPHATKIVVAGNHDICLEKYPGKARSLLTNAIYLQDEQTFVGDLLFYGSPWSPKFFNWAFMLNRGQALAEKWNAIPVDTDVLITHSPPYGILDDALVIARNGTEYTDPAGSKSLRDKVNELSLKAHFFGHIHNGQGSQEPYHNVAICDERYSPVNLVKIVDL